MLLVTCFERWCPTKKKRTCCDTGAGAVHAQGRSAIRHCSAQACTTSIPFASLPSRVGMGGCLTMESPRATPTGTQQKQGVGKVCSTIRRAIRDKGHSMPIGFRSWRDHWQHGPPERCRGKAPQKKKREINPNSRPGTSWHLRGRRRLLTESVTSRPLTEPRRSKGAFARSRAVHYGKMAPLHKGRGGVHSNRILCFVASRGRDHRRR